MVEVVGSLLVMVDNCRSWDIGSVCSSVDGTFSQAALKGKIQIKEQLPKYFGGEVQLGEFAVSYLVMVVIHPPPQVSDLGILKKNIPWEHLYLHVTYNQGFTSLGTYEWLSPPPPILNTALLMHAVHLGTLSDEYGSHLLQWRQGVWSVSFNLLVRSWVEQCMWPRGSNWGSAATRKEEEQQRNAYSPS